MKTKHTKGKWSIDIESDGNIWIASDKSVSCIANVCSGEVDGKHEPTTEEQANAKLIAAAPELLNNLQETNECLKRLILSDQINNLRDKKAAIDTINKNNKSIKKATE